MARLYELTEQYAAVAELMDDESVDEQVIADTLESIDGEIEDKADNYARMIRNMLSDAEAIKVEEYRLSSRRRSLETRAAYLKTTLQENMAFIGKTSFKTELFSFNIQKNGGKQPLTITENLDDIPMRFLIQQPPLPDKEAIRSLLEQKEVEWATLEPRGESLRIR